VVLNLDERSMGEKECEGEVRRESRRFALTAVVTRGGERDAGDMA
jgi:hypothetical protein